MMRIEAQINTKMRTLNDPKQAAKLREVLYKFEEQNSKKLKCFAAGELENSKNFNKLQKDILERQAMSDIDTLAPVEFHKYFCIAIIILSHHSILLDYQVLSHKYNDIFFLLLYIQLDYSIV